jgi:hypothetical protein
MGYRRNIEFSLEGSVHINLSKAVISILSCGRLEVHVKQISRSSFSLHMDSNGFYLFNDDIIDRTIIMCTKVL